MTTDVILVSDDQQRFTLGGKLESVGSSAAEAQKYASAIAHFDASRDELVFAKSSSQANSISALATSADNSKLLALAYNEAQGVSLFITMDLSLSGAGDLIGAPQIIEGLATSIIFAPAQSAALVLVPEQQLLHSSSSIIYQVAASNGAVTQLDALTNFQAAKTSHGAFLALDNNRIIVAGSIDGQAALYDNQSSEQILINRRALSDDSIEENKISDQEKDISDDSIEENKISDQEKDNYLSTITHIFQTKDQGSLIAIEKKQNQAEMTTMATFSVQRLHLSDDLESDLATLFQESANELNSVHFSEATGALHMLFSFKDGDDDESQKFYVVVDTLDGSVISRDEITVSHEMTPLTLMTSQDSDAEARLPLLSKATVMDILENFQSDADDDEEVVQEVEARELTGADQDRPLRQLTWWDDPNDDAHEMHWVDSWCGDYYSYGSGCTTCQTSYPDQPDREYTLGSSPLIFTVGGIEPERCGYYYSYEVTSYDGYQVITSFNDRTRTFQIFTNDESILRGHNSRQFRVTMIACGYYTVKSSFYLTIKARGDEGGMCTDPSMTQIDRVPQRDDCVPDSYSGEEIVWFYEAFTTSPASCQSEVVVHCESVSPEVPGLPCQELVLGDFKDGADGKITWQFDQEDYLSGRIPPGDYIFTYCVGIPGMHIYYWRTFKVKLTLLDPCNPPEFVGQLALQNQMYMIGAEELFYEHPDLPVTPDFCPVEYDYEIEALSDGGRPIRREDKIFDIFWDEDNTPVEEGPLNVKITATVTSPYAVGSSSVVVGDFDVIFKARADPCPAPETVEIIPPPLETKDFIIGTDMEQVFSNDAFTIVTSPPIDLDNCPGLEDLLMIEAKFDQDLIGPTDDPLSYAPGATGTSIGDFTLFTENPAFTGQEIPYSLTATIDGYPSSSAVTTSTIKFLADPCPEPETIEINPPVLTAKFYQVGTDMQQVFSNDAFEIVTTPKIDLDNCPGLEDLLKVEAKFDKDLIGPNGEPLGWIEDVSGDGTGSFSLFTEDEAFVGQEIPYSLTATIEGYPGSKAVTASTVSFTTDPCPAPESIEINPPVLTTKFYEIGTDPLESFKNAGFEIVTTPPIDLVNCPGLEDLLVIEAKFNNDVIDGNDEPLAYTVDASGPGTGTFELFTDDSALAGQEIPYSLSAVIDGYPGSKAVTASTITFTDPVDPCAMPDSVTISPPDLPDKTFDIGTSPKDDFTNMAFTVVTTPQLDFTICPDFLDNLVIEATFDNDVIDENGTPLSYTPDGTGVGTGTFSLFTDEMTFAGKMIPYSLTASFPDYPLSDVTVEKTVTFTADPCPTPETVTITPPNLDAQFFDIGTDLQKDFNNMPFMIMTAPQQLDFTICPEFLDDLMIEATFDSGLIDENGSPLSYTSGVDEFGVGTFSLFTDDTNLAGEEVPFTLTASFPNYPNSAATADSTVSFTTDPCPDPDSVQINPPSLEAKMFDIGTSAVDVFTNMAFEIVTTPSLDFGVCPDFLDRLMIEAQFDGMVIGGSDDPLKFELNGTGVGVGIFTLFTDNTSYAGREVPYRLTATVDGYPASNVNTQSTITFTTDPCPTPETVTITPPNLDAQFFDIGTDLQKDFNNMPFMIMTAPQQLDFTICPEFLDDLMIEATFDSGLIDENGSPLSYTSGVDEFGVGTFSLFTDDTNFADREVPFTLTASFPNYPNSAATADSTVSFTTDPCPDPDSVQITAPGLPNKTFDIGTSPKDDFTNMAFTVVTTPQLDFTICPDFLDNLVIEATFDNDVIDENGTPLSYTPDGTGVGTGTFSLFTDNANFADREVPYSLTASFPNYAGSQVSTQGTVSFTTDPCPNPDSVQITAPGLPNKTFDIGTSPKDDFTNMAFTVVTTPQLDFTICPDFLDNLVIEATFDNDVIDENGTPLSYTPDGTGVGTGTFSLFTDNANFADREVPYSLTASFPNYTGSEVSTQGTVSFTTDPCPTPDDVLIIPPTLSAQFFDIGTDLQKDFNNMPFMIMTAPQQLDFTICPEFLDDLAIEATFDSAVIDENGTPLSFGLDGTGIGTGQFSLFTDNTTFADREVPYALTASFPNYPNSAATADSTVSFTTDPCPNPDSVQITAPVLPNKTFDIGTSLQDDFTNMAFTVVTTPPLDFTICPDFLDNLVIEATFDNDVIDENGTPLSYTPDGTGVGTGTFSLFTDEMAFAGSDLPYSLTASFPNYAGSEVSTQGTVTFTTDPCPTPDSVTITAPNLPNKIFDIGTSPRDDFTNMAFIVETMPQLDFTICPEFLDNLVIEAKFDNDVIDENGTPLSYTPDGTGVGTGTFSLFTDNANFADREVPYSLTASFPNYAGSDVSTQGTVTFTTDPCPTPNSVTITAPELPDKSFEIGVSPQEDFNNMPFMIVTEPQQLDFTICPEFLDGLMVEARFNGDAIDGTGSPLSYTSGVDEFGVGTFSLFTEDTNLAGEALPYTLTATLTEYPGVEGMSMGTITFSADPCRDPDTVTINAPTLEAKTFAIGQDQTDNFANLPFEIITTPQIDFAECPDFLNKFSVEAKFDNGVIGETSEPLAYTQGVDGNGAGIFSLFTDDLAFADQMIPYSLTAMVEGYLTSETTISNTITFIDPCPDPTSVTITSPGLDPKSFAIGEDTGQTFSNLPFVINTTPQIDLNNCPSLNDRLMIVATFNGFAIDATGSPLSWQLDGSGGVGTGTFQLFTDDVNFADQTVPYSLTAVVDGYPASELDVSSMVSFTFDACASAVCTVAECAPVTYTLTDNVQFYNFPQVTCVPAECTATATVDLDFNFADGNQFTDEVFSVVQADRQLRLNDDSGTLDLITLGDPTNRDESKEYSGIYSLTVNGELTEKTCPVTFANPCINPDFVSWQFTDFPDDISYAIGNFPQVQCCYAVELITQPRDHALCGTLEVVPYFNGNEMRYADDSFNIAPLTRQICQRDGTCSDVIVETFDGGLEGTSQWSVRAFLPEYSSIPYQEEFADVVFTPQCVTVRSFENTNENFDFGNYDYIATPTTQTFTPMTVNPSVCDITYYCETIADPSGLIGSSCEGQEQNLNFDSNNFRIGIDFSPDDYDLFPPGLYNFQLRGCYGDATSGDQCSTFNVQFTLTNLCQGGLVKLTLNDVFRDMTYELLQPADTQMFNLEEVYTLVPNIDCGQVDIIFIQTDTGQDMTRDDFNFVQSENDPQTITLGPLDSSFFGFLEDEYPDLDLGFKLQFPDAVLDGSLIFPTAAFRLDLIDPALKSVVRPPPPLLTLQLPPPELAVQSANIKKTTNTGGIEWLESEVVDMSVQSGDRQTATYNNGRCEGPPGSTDAQCTLISSNDRKTSRFVIYDQRINRLTVLGTVLRRDDEGVYDLTMEVSYRVANRGLMTQRKSFVLTTRYIDPSRNKKTSLQDVKQMIYMARMDFRGSVFSSPPVRSNSQSKMIAFVRRVTSTGRVALGFSQPLSSRSDALREALFGGRRTRVSAIRRRLSVDRQQVVFLSEDGGVASDEVYELFDVIELTLASTKSDDIEPIQVDWSDINIDSPDQISLQIMDLDKIQNLDQYDKIEVSFNDAQNFFEPIDGSEGLDFGQQTSWNIDSILVNKSDNAETLEMVGQIGLVLIMISVALSLLLSALSECRLESQVVSTWIFLCWLQLVAHLLLVQGLLPAPVRLMIRPVLDGLRLRSFDASGLETVELLQTDSGSFLQSNGYYSSFAANTICILAFLALLTTGLAMTRMTSRCRASKQNRFRNFLAQVILRATLFFAFELWLCASIGLGGSSSSPPQATSMVFSVATLSMTAMTAAYLLSQYCLNGPYLSETYAERSMFGSFWGTRQLHPDLIAEYLQRQPEKLSETPHGLEQKEAIDEVKPGSVSTPQQQQQQQQVDNTNTNTQTLTMADTMSGALQLRSAVARKVVIEGYEGGEAEVAQDVVVEDVGPETEPAMVRMHTYENNDIGGRIGTERALFTEEDHDHDEELSPTRPGTAEQTGKVERRATTQARQYSKYTEQARLMLRLESLVAKATANQKRSNLFYLGLKLNTPHNTAITQPLLSLSTRFLAAITLFHLQDSPQLAVLTLMVLSLAQIVFNQVEKPWTDSNMTYLTCINEVLLYLILCLGLAANTASVVPKTSMVALISCSVAANLLWQAYQSVRTAKLIFMRFQRRKALNKVAAFSPELLAKIADGDKPKSDQVTSGQPADSEDQPKRMYSVDLHGNVKPTATGIDGQPRLYVVDEEDLVPTDQPGGVRAHDNADSIVLQEENQPQFRFTSMLHPDNDQQQQQQKCYGSKEGAMQQSLRMVDDHVIEMDLEDYSVQEEIQNSPAAAAAESYKDDGIKATPIKQSSTQPAMTPDTQDVGQAIVRVKHYQTSNENNVHSPDDIDDDDNGYF